MNTENKNTDLAKNDIKTVLSDVQCEQGYKGDCCCNCIHQVKIHCHPWNGEQKEYVLLEDKIKVGKGSVKKRFAWGCSIFDNNPDLTGNKERIIIYSDREHGMCEMHYNVSSIAEVGNK